MKKLLMVAGVMSFLALSISAQGINGFLGDSKSSDKGTCEIVTNMKGEKERRCCTDKIEHEGDMVHRHTRICRVEVLLDS